MQSTLKRSGKKKATMGGNAMKERSRPMDEALYRVGRGVGRKPNRAAENYQSTTTLAPRLISKSGRTSIVGMEPVCAVNASGSAFAFGLGLDPANSGIFPWASSILQNYNQYKWRTCELAFVGNQPTTTGGQLTLGMFYQYEEFNQWITAGYPTGQLQLTDPNVTGPLYGNYSSKQFRDNPMCITLDCSDYRKRTPWLNCVAAATASAEDNQAVEFYLGCAGSSAVNGFIGTIFCRYEIELQRPVPLAATTKLFFNSQYNGYKTPVGNLVSTTETNTYPVTGSLPSQVSLVVGFASFILFTLNTVIADAGYATLTAPTKSLIMSAKASCGTVTASSTAPTTITTTTSNMLSTISSLYTLATAVPTAPTAPS